MTRPSTSPPCTVLVVEDSWVVAQGLKLLLTELGMIMIGPAGSVADALALALSAQPALALVDLNLRGQMADTVVDRLLERKVPVVLTSGYSRDAIPPRFRNLPWCSKPYSAETLLAAVSRVTSRAG